MDRTVNPRLGEFESHGGSHLWGCSSIDRAGSLQGSGLGFESPLLHQFYLREL